MKPSPTLAVNDLATTGSLKYTTQSVESSTAWLVLARVSVFKFQPVALLVSLSFASCCLCCRCCRPFQEGDLSADYFYIATWHKSSSYGKVGTDGTVDARSNTCEEWLVSWCSTCPHLCIPLRFRVESSLFRRTRLKRRAPMQRRPIVGVRFERTV